MNLMKGKHILIDGYNLRLPYVTGIRNYSETLMAALALLGARVSVLWDCPTNDWPVSELVAFDANRSLGRLTKLKTYMSLLMPWGAKASVVFGSRRVTVPPPSYEFLAAVNQLFTVPWCYEASNHIYYKLGWISTIALPDKSIDVFHMTYPIPIDIKGLPKITTIHDLVPIRMPYFTLDIKRAYYNLVRWTLQTSAAIFVVSNFTKTDILDVFPDYDPEKIVVTYQAVMRVQVSEKFIETILRKFRLNRLGFILFVGTIEPKKNVGRLIDAYAGIDTEFPLVIVGRKGWLWEGEIGKLEAIFGRGWFRKVRLLDQVTRQELWALYSSAYCLVFPSLYEGFGLPVAEAMTCGTPVICSSVASLPEVCQDAALYVDPYDVGSIKRAIETLLSDPRLRDTFSQKAREQAEKFSMERYVDTLRAAYTKILSR